MVWLVGRRLHLCFDRVVVALYSLRQQRFCKIMFTESSTGRLFGCTAADMLPKQENFQKTYYKTFLSSCRLRLYCTSGQFSYH